MTLVSWCRSKLTILERYVAHDDPAVPGIGSMPDEDNGVARPVIVAGTVCVRFYGVEAQTWHWKMLLVADVERL